TCVAPGGRHRGLPEPRANLQYADWSSPAPYPGAVRDRPPDASRFPRLGAAHFQARGLGSRTGKLLRNGELLQSPCGNPMEARPPSYVSGISSAPLLGETIGDNFDRMAARFANREALVVRHQGVRWSYGRLSAA